MFLWYYTTAVPGGMETLPTAIQCLRWGAVALVCYDCDSSHSYFSILSLWLQQPSRLSMVTHPHMPIKKRSHDEKQEEDIHPMSHPGKTTRKVVQGCCPCCRFLPVGLGLNRGQEVWTIKQSFSRCGLAHRWSILSDLVWLAVNLSIAVLTPGIQSGSYKMIVSVLGFSPTLI